MSDLPGASAAVDDATAPVDAVVAWVDGSDPAHAAKRVAHLPPFEHQTNAERVASAAQRFSDNDELRYCVRSIRNHAPWIRTIWIVTDDQRPRAFDPKLAEAAGIRIVDHRALFRGHEDLLPTFNSLSIETMLWRVPGLAPLFLYLNDDMLITRPTTREDFYKGERPILRGGWRRFDREGPISFHDHNRRQGATAAGWSGPRYFASAHVAHAMRRDILEELYGRDSRIFVENARPRFRKRLQFWPVSLHDHEALQSGRAVVFEGKPRDWLHFSMDFCRTAEPDRVRARLDALARHEVALGCVNFAERVTEKVPDAMRYLAEAAGPPLACETAEASGA